MKLDPDPRLPTDGGVGRLVTRLYEVLRQVARAVNARADGYVAPSAVVSASYTMGAGDVVVLMSASGGARTVTLMPPAQALGKLVAVRKTDAGANTVTIQPPSGTIDGAATLVLTAAAPKATLVSDGTNFFTV